MLLYILVMPIGWLLWHILFRIKVIGRENLIKDRGFIITPNHISALDPVFVLMARFWGKRMVIFAKRELMQNPFAAFFLRCAGCVAVRGAGKDERETVDATIEACKNGRGLLIFPEGTRSKDGNLGSPKSGAFVVAAAAEVDMIPCRIIYDTPDGRLKLFCRTRVVFGTPIPASHFTMPEGRDIKKLRAAKKELVDCWESLYAANQF